MPRFLQPWANTQTIYKCLIQPRLKNIWTMPIKKWYKSGQLHKKIEANYNRSPNNAFYLDSSNQISKPTVKSFLIKPQNKKRATSPQFLTSINIELRIRGDVAAGGDGGGGVRIKRPMCRLTHAHIIIVKKGHAYMNTNSLSSVQV